MDANHTELYKALEACGWTLKDTHHYPRFVDAVGHRRGELRLFEFKTAKGRRTASQQELLDLGFEITFLQSIEDVARL